MKHYLKRFVRTKCANFYHLYPRLVMTCEHGDIYVNIYHKYVSIHIIVNIRDNHFAH